jgi:hypothetical protein
MRLNKDGLDDIVYLSAPASATLFEPSADEIRFNIPGPGPFTFSPNNFGLSDAVETVTIDGTFKRVDDATL